MGGGGRKVQELGAARYTAPVPFLSPHDAAVFFITCVNWLATQSSTGHNSSGVDRQYSWLHKLMNLALPEDPYVSIAY